MSLLYLFLGGALLIVIDASEICTENDGHDCMEEIITELLKHPKNSINCKTVMKAENCLKDVHERCINFQQIPFYEEMRELVRNERSLCLWDSHNTSVSEAEMVRCLQDLKKVNSFFEECSLKAFEQLYTGEIQMGSNLRDTECATSLSIAHCVKKAVGEHCGKRAEKPFYFGMLQKLKSTDMSHSPECATAIRDYPVEYAISDFLREQDEFQDSEIININLKIIV